MTMKRTIRKTISLTKIIAEKATQLVAFLFYEMLPNILHVNGLDFIKHSAASLQFAIFATVFGRAYPDFMKSVILFRRQLIVNH